MFKEIICYNINKMNFEQRMKTFNVSREIAIKKFLIGHQIKSKYREANKDKIIQEQKEYRKKYNEVNKEKRTEQMKKYNELLRIWRIQKSLTMRVFYITPGCKAL